MPRKGWISISLKEDFVKKMEEYIKNNPDLGYTSISSLIVDSLRHLFVDIEKDVVPEKKLYVMGFSADGKTILKIK